MEPIKTKAEAEAKPYVNCRLLDFILTVATGLRPIAPKTSRNPRVGYALVDFSELAGLNEQPSRYWISLLCRFGRRSGANARSLQPYS